MLKYNVCTCSDEFEGDGVVVLQLLIERGVGQVSESSLPRPTGHLLSVLPCPLSLARLPPPEAAAAARVGLQGDLD